MHTAVDDFILVQVVNSTENLLDCLGGVLLGKLALFANTVEQFSAGSELGYNIELILQEGVSVSFVLNCFAQRVSHTLDSNQSTNLTMCGCFRVWSIRSSS